MMMMIIQKLIDCRRWHSQPLTKEAHQYCHQQPSSSPSLSSVLENQQPSASNTIIIITTSTGKSSSPSPSSPSVLENHHHHHWKISSPKASLAFAPCEGFGMVGSRDWLLTGKYFNHLTATTKSHHIYADFLSCSW